MHRVNQSGSSSSKAADSLHTDSHYEDCAPVLFRLLDWDTIEKWQQDNPFIHKGYVRSESSFKKVFASLFYVHNETGNIYSHGIAAIGVLVLLIWWLIGPNRAAAAYAVFYCSVILCLGMSATFHLIKSHSELVQTTGNKLDYLGICVLIAGSMVSLLSFALSDHPRLQAVFSTILLSFGLVCSCVSLMDRFRSVEWRPYRAAMFVAYGLSGIIPIVYCGLKMGWPQAWERCAMGWMITSGFSYIAGAVLYGALFPEKWMPGRVDIWGHSHQVFHCCVVFAAWCHFKALCGAELAAHARGY